MTAYSVNPNIGFSILQTADGGYLIAGACGEGDMPTNVSGSIPASANFGGRISGGYWGTYRMPVYGMLIKTNSIGAVQWCRRFLPKTPTNESEIHSISPIAGGGFILAGGFAACAGSYGGYNGGFTNGGAAWPARPKSVYLTRIDNNGNMVWENAYTVNTAAFADEIAYSVDTVTLAGALNGFIAAGSTKKTASGREAIYVVRTDTNGNVLWSKIVKVDNATDDCAYSVKQVSDGNFVIAGQGAGRAYLLGLREVANLPVIAWSNTYDANTCFQSLTSANQSELPWVSGVNSINDIRSGKTTDPALVSAPGN